MDIAATKVAEFVDLARRFDVKDAAPDGASGSNGLDDGMTDVLLDGPEDAIGQELAGFIAGLNEDERAELVALVWVGRGDFEPEEWTDAVKMARQRREGPTSRYLLGIPNVADLAAEGLAEVEDRQQVGAVRTPEVLAAAPDPLHPEQDVPQPPPTSGSA